MDELLERLEDHDDDESSLDGTPSPDIETSAPLVDQSEVCTSWVYFRIPLKRGQTHTSKINLRGGKYKSKRAIIINTYRKNQFPRGGG